MKPLAIDLFCGLGGWAEGFLAEGYDVVGFDIERHDYGTGGYPGQLVLQDVLTLHGSRFCGAAVIVASPPCREFSYMAMPWSRAKQIARALRGEDEFPKGYTGSRTVEELTALFRACFRIAEEAGLPLVVENVRGAEPWVGGARWHFGSFYLWGDVPALVPISRTGVKRPGMNWSDRSNPDRTFNNPVKVESASGRRTAPGNGTRFTSRDCGVEGRKQEGSGAIWFDTGIAKHSSRSDSRKAASAQIAKIPFPLAQHIASVFKPIEARAG